MTRERGRLGGEGRGFYSPRARRQVGLVLGSLSTGSPNRARPQERVAARGWTLA